VQDLSPPKYEENGYRGVSWVYALGTSAPMDFSGSGFKDNDSTADAMEHLKFDSSDSKTATKITVEDLPRQLDTLIV
jgi:hypothetical protein